MNNNKFYSGNPNTNFNYMTSNTMNQMIYHSINGIGIEYPITYIFELILTGKLSSSYNILPIG